MESVAAETLALKGVCAFAISDTKNSVTVQTEGYSAVANDDDQTEKTAMPAFAALNHLSTVNTCDVGVQVTVQDPS